MEFMSTGTGRLGNITKFMAMTKTEDKNKCANIPCINSRSILPRKNAINITQSIHCVTVTIRI